MKKFFLFVFLFFSVVLHSGCGYSTRALSPSLQGKKTIHISAFDNAIDYGRESRDRSLYIPMMEVNITNAVINRFIFDGNLRVSDRDEADLILIGELLDSRRDVLRYDDDDDAQEYRIRIIVLLVLQDVASDQVLWRESRFIGDATYFVTGPNAKPEQVAVEEAIEDLARRIVNRTIEDW